MLEATFVRGHGHGARLLVRTLRTKEKIVDHDLLETARRYRESWQGYPESSA